MESHLRLFLKRWLLVVAWYLLRCLGQELVECLQTAQDRRLRRRIILLDVGKRPRRGVGSNTIIGCPTSKKEHGYSMEGRSCEVGVAVPTPP